MEHGATTGDTRSPIRKPVAFQSDTFRVSHFALLFALETISDGFVRHRKAPFNIAMPLLLPIWKPIHHEVDGKFGKSE